MIASDVLLIAALLGLVVVWWVKHPPNGMRHC
jgi:hypothetical protein